jgi:hypothetical protein
MSHAALQRDVTLYKNTPCPVSGRPCHRVPIKRQKCPEIRIILEGSSFECTVAPKSLSEVGSRTPCRYQNLRTLKSLTENGTEPVFCIISTISVILHKM